MDLTEERKYLSNAQYDKFTTPLTNWKSDHEIDVQVVESDQISHQLRKQEETVNII